MNFGTMSKHTMCLCSTPGASHHKSGGEACHCCGHYTSRDTCHGKCPPPAYKHAYVSMSSITSYVPTVTSPPSPPSTRFWRRYARKMAGVRRSAPTQPRREHSALLRGRTPSFPLPPLTFPPSIEFAGVLVVVLGQLCSKLRLLCYASMTSCYALGWVLLCSIHRLLCLEFN